MTRPVRHRQRASFIGWSLVAGLMLSLAQPRVGQSAGASLSLSPRSVTIEVGETTTVQVLVASTGQAINAAEATVSFPKELLEASAVSKSGSVLTLWAVDPASSNTGGTATFSGGLPSPGYTGGAKRVISITFRAKKAGTATLTLGAAQVLANDGLGTNILSGTAGATITIREKAPTNANITPPAEPTTLPAPTIVSDTHPDQNRWYVVREVAARWTAGAGVRGYNAVFDQSATTVPPEVDEGTTAIFRRTNLTDGVWYLHVRARYQQQWSVVRHFAFQIDGTPPAQFSLTVDHPHPNDQQATVTFETTDATSGVAKTEGALDGGAFAVVTSPWTLTKLLPGSHTVTARATDRAGNVRETTMTISVEGQPAPTVFFDEQKVRLIGDSSLVPTFVSGTPLRLRGYARLTDTVHVVVRSSESVFDFPVAEIVDPAPIEPAPPGLTAWKIEISPDLNPGDHEIRISTKDASGLQTAEAPVIRFRVVTNVAQIGSVLIPYPFLLKVLATVIGLLLAAVAFLVIVVIRNRRRKPKKIRRTTDITQAQD